MQQTNRIAARVVLFWLVLGYDLSWHKGQLGHDIDWIGFHIAHTPQSVTAEIKGDYMEDLLSITERIKTMNIVPRKTLQSYAGKCSHVANLLFAWKPYLEPFWAALYTPKPSRAFKRGIWRVQVEQALFWVHAFLSKSQGTLSRTWLLSAYLNQGTPLTFTLDASPWGLGGVLEIDGILREYFVSPLTMTDSRIRKAKWGIQGANRLLSSCAS